MEARRERTAGSAAPAASGPREVHPNRWSFAACCSSAGPSAADSRPPDITCSPSRRRVHRARGVAREDRRAEPVVAVVRERRSSARRRSRRVPRTRARLLDPTRHHPQLGDRDRARLRLRGARMRPRAFGADRRRRGVRDRHGRRADARARGRPRRPRGAGCRAVSGAGRAASGNVQRRAGACDAPSIDAQAPRRQAPRP
jgi:hypothetical protein